jgi:hypothetical protein
MNSRGATEKEADVKLAGYFFLSASVVLFLITVVVAVVSGVLTSFG